VKASLRDIALFLLERIQAYYAGNEEALDELSAQLTMEGIGNDQIHGALAWLRAGVSGEAVELVPPESVDPARRVLTREERGWVSPDAFGFLLRLAAEGRLGGDQIESILAELGGSAEPVDLGTVQELAWRVASGNWESETDFGPTRTTIH